MNDTVISCRNLVKQFSQGDLAVPVLKGVNLDLIKGEMLAIVGASVPAKARCCIYSADWMRRQAGISGFSGKISRKSMKKSAAGYAMGRSASSTSFIICYRNSARWRM